MSKGWKGQEEEGIRIGEREQKEVREREGKE